MESTTSTSARKLPLYRSLYVQVITAVIIGVLPGTFTVGSHGNPVSVMTFGLPWIGRDLERAGGRETMPLKKRLSFSGRC